MLFRCWHHTICYAAWRTLSLIIVFFCVQLTCRESFLTPAAAASRGGSDVSTLKRLSSFGQYLSKTSKISELPNISWNRSLLYIKPHANTSKARAFVRKHLGSINCQLLGEGSLSSIDLRNSFDLQFSDISRKAVELEPYECSLSSNSMMEFEKKFKIAWSVAVKKKLVYSSRGSSELFGISPQTLNQAWMECVGNGKMVKLGRGFYCGLIDTIPNKPAVFCINGFFMAMRAEYLAATASVHYFLVEWDNAAMSWGDFRKKVVGATNPSLAHPESLRYIMSTEWQELGLDRPLDMMRNGIHASASAFEALVERSIWLKVSAASDVFGAELFKLSLTPEVMRDWLANVSVKGKPIFDHMEDKGSRDCLDVAKQLLATDTPKRKCDAIYASLVLHVVC
jgi:nucleoside diphosphate kinase